MSKALQQPLQSERGIGVQYGSSTDDVDLCQGFRRMLPYDSNFSPLHSATMHEFSE